MTHFSIITSTLNSSKDIERCIKSVECQTYRNYEHLIIDGGSTDNTIGIVKNSKNPNLKIVCSERDDGIYQAWNKGLKYSKGDWIITLGSDDYLISNLDLEYAAAFINDLKEGDDINFIYAETSDDNEMKVIEKNRKFLPRYRGITAYPTAVFINKKLINQGRFFDETYKICGDHKFFHENLFWEKSICFPRKIYHFSVGGISTNKKFKLTNYYERKKMLSEIGKRRPLMFEIYYYLRAIF
jgi:glycosyltransferase involved in cell wall biosynthesis